LYNSTTAHPEDRLWNRKKPAAEIIRMGALLANKDAV